MFLFLVSAGRKANSTRMRGNLQALARIIGTFSNHAVQDLVFIEPYRNRNYLSVTKSVLKLYQIIVNCSIPSFFIFICSPLFAETESSFIVNF